MKISTAWTILILFFQTLFAVILGFVVSPFTSMFWVIYITVFFLTFFHMMRKDALHNEAIDRVAKKVANDILYSNKYRK